MFGTLQTHLDKLGFMFEIEIGMHRLQVFLVCDSKSMAANNQMQLILALKHLTETTHTSQ